MQWRDFYDTTLPITDTNIVNWNSDPLAFRYEVRSDDERHITSDRQVYILELTGTTSTADMNPPFSETHVVTLVVNHGCDNDVITN